MSGTRRTPWRFGVPVVCLLAGLLLAATHGVSGGSEIRRSDAPRLVDLVRAAQSSVSGLNAERDELARIVDGWVAVEVCAQQLVDIDQKVFRRGLAGKRMDGHGLNYCAGLLARRLTGGKYAPFNSRFHQFPV